MTTATTEPSTSTGASSGRRAKGIEAVANDIVSNLITARPKLEPTNLEDDLEDALIRSVKLDATHHVSRQSVSDLIQRLKRVGCSASSDSSRARNPRLHHRLRPHGPVVRAHFQRRANPSRGERSCESQS
jgi:hypothetical protein